MEHPEVAPPTRRSSDIDDQLNSIELDIDQLGDTVDQLVQALHPVSLQKPRDPEVIAAPGDPSLSPIAHTILVHRRNIQSQRAKLEQALEDLEV